MTAKTAKRTRATTKSKTTASRKKQTVKKSTAKKPAAKRKPVKKKEAVKTPDNTLPLSALYPNPEQARKHFDEAKLHELAASIRQHGLMQPIVVRPDDQGKYMIIAGERRYRACNLIELESVPVVIRQISDEDLACQMMIENLQRQDITPMEEARGYCKMMDDFKLDVPQLAQRLGIHQPHRIRERLSLLQLKPEYQEYFERDILNPTQAYYLSTVAVHHQEAFWQKIKRGDVPSSMLASVAQAFIDAENQAEMFADAKLSADEVKALKSAEDKINRLFSIVNGFCNDKGELVILKKIDPSRASSAADKIKATCQFLAMVERQLREPAAKQKVMEVIAA